MVCSTNLSWIVERLHTVKCGKIYILHVNMQFLGTLNSFTVCCASFFDSVFDCVTETYVHLTILFSSTTECSSKICSMLKATVPLSFYLTVWATKTEWFLQEKYFEGDLVLQLLANWWTVPFSGFKASNWLHGVWLSLLRCMYLTLTMPGSCVTLEYEDTDFIWELTLLHLSTQR